MYTTRFFKYLEFEKRSSLHTQKAYVNDLSQCQLFIHTNYPDTDISKADHFMIRSFIINLLENETGSASIHRKISCLRSFFRFCVKESYIVQSPMNRILLPAIAKKLPVIISESKINAVLDDQEFAAGFKGLRDHLIIELLYATGIRLSELIGIGDNDIDFISSQVKVTGKRKKQRVIPFHPLLSDSIQRYLLVRNSLFEIRSVSAPLLVTDKNEKLYPRLVYRIVTTALAKITSQEKKSPHILRHSYATSLLNRGADLNAIKELLGHASLAATQIYTHNSISRLKKVYDQAHPKA